MARIHTTIEKSLNDHGNDGVGTQLEPDILECEVKWALAKLILYSELKSEICGREPPEPASAAPQIYGHK